MLLNTGGIVPAADIGGRPPEWLRLAPQSRYQQPETVAERLLAGGAWYSLTQAWACRAYCVAGQLSGVSSRPAAHKRKAHRLPISGTRWAWVTGYLIRRM